MKAINLYVKVPVSRERVWALWTTEEGLASFFAPRCNIEIRPGGAYEMLFLLDNPPGLQGGEDMIVLAVQEPEMLSFTWNAPPEMPEVRGQMTHVTLRFEDCKNGSTKVTLNHDGWGTGEKWEEAHKYFQHAWGEIVLPRMIAACVVQND